MNSKVIKKIINQIGMVKITDVKFMSEAVAISSISKANRNKVGCIITKNNKVLSNGVNGTLPGTDNNCEVDPYTTKPDVIHAEMNALAKISKSRKSSKGCILYVTLSPCLQCALMIITFGIKKVFYKEMYRDSSGVDFLIQNNIEVYKID